MRSQPGTYALILRNRARAQVQVGRRGRLNLKPGYYIYVGSAFGPGGVQARVSRHCRQDKRKHWHIDYLRDFLTPVTAWCSYGTERLEHRWAHAFARLKGTSSSPGFGCSDCWCESHLFHLPTAPDATSFAALMDSAAEIRLTG